MIIGCCRNKLEFLCKVIVVTLTRFALYLDTQTEHMVYKMGWIKTTSCFVGFRKRVALSHMDM
jgi:hypothetical protein